MSDIFRNQQSGNRSRKSLGSGLHACGSTVPDGGFVVDGDADPVRIVTAGLMTPDSNYTTLPPESLVGRSIKVPFQTGNESVENMWVTVTAVDGDSLIGKLDSDPVVTEDLRYGDEVRVSRRAIIAVHLTYREWARQVDALRRKEDFRSRWLGSPIGRRFDRLYHEGLSPRQALTWWRDFEPYEED